MRTHFLHVALASTLFWAGQAWGQDTVWERDRTSVGAAVGSLLPTFQRCLDTHVLIEGEVDANLELQFVVDRQGIPREVRVQEGTGAPLEVCLVAAVGRLNFAPGRQAVPVVVPVTARASEMRTQPANTKG